MILDDAIDRASAVLELTRVEDKYVVTHQEKNYHVRKSFFETLESIRKESAQRAFQRLQYEHNLSDVELSELKGSISTRLDEMLEPKKESGYIKLSFTIFPAGVVGRVGRHLTFLFEKHLFFALSLLGIFVNALFVWQHGLYNDVSINFSFSDGVIIYFTILLTLLFHEFGHATATMFYQLKPKEIGFGFYIAFPVLFANVSGTWKLEKRARITVNLAGVYFQSIVNSLLFIVMMFADAQISGIAAYIFRINLIVALSVLVPFIRNDGYWVFSDFFDIQNLNDKAYKAPLLTLMKYFNGMSYKDFSVILLAYSICNYAFLIFTLWTFLASVPTTYRETLAVFLQAGLLGLVGNHFGLFVAAIFSIIGLFLIIRQPLIRLGYLIAYIAGKF
jgi:putative peptide zinc metalloprotease protein